MDWNLPLTRYVLRQRYTPSLAVNFPCSNLSQCSLCDQETYEGENLVQESLVAMVSIQSFLAAFVFIERWTETRLGGSYGSGKMPRQNVRYHARNFPYQ